MKKLFYLLISVLITLGVLYACSEDNNTCVKKAYKRPAMLKNGSLIKRLVNVTLTEDTIYDGDTTIDGSLDLNGFTLTVNGTLTITNNLQGGGTIIADNVIVYNNINSGGYDMTINGDCLSVGGNLNSEIEINGGNYHITGTTPGSGSITGTSTESMDCEIDYLLDVDDIYIGEEVVISCDKEWGVIYDGYIYYPRN